jgi:hypothetical protein
MKNKTKFHAVDLTISKECCKQCGLLRVFWGLDIFINNVPFLKSIALGNIIVWIILFLMR